MEKILFKIAKQWIAGDTMEDALKSAHDANVNGMSAILNKLGEHLTSKGKLIRQFQIISPLSQTCENQRLLADYQ